MNGYRKVNKLGPEDAAYIAGLIDGEGTISLARKHRNDNRQLVVSISSTEPVLLEFVLRTVGAGRITRKRAYSTRHTPSVTFTISNRQALALLEQVAPYLRTYKTQRANLVLDHYVRLTPRNGKYDPAQTRERESLITQFLNLNPRRYVCARSP